jgi:SAM-dependent methyltransferase
VAGAAVAAGATAAVVNHRLGFGASRQVPGGVLIGNATAYERFSDRLMGGFLDGVAADVAAVAPAAARVLELGCGPGHLAIRLSRDHGLNVTGLDLDPAMIERARAAAGRGSGAQRPSFVVGSATSLAFAERSFDLVVSTLSMHHWSDPAASLAEIARVLAPTGRALIWDVRPHRLPMHAHPPDPAEHAPGSGLRVVRAAPWRWPGPLAVTQRIELVPESALRMSTGDART